MADPHANAVLVCGASSQIGFFLLPELVRAGVPLFALSRRTQTPLAGVTWLQGALPQVPAAANVAGSVCSFAPLDALAAWIETGAAANLQCVVATSSMSAESKRASPVAAEREVSRRLHEGEEAVARACDKRGIAWTILRPTLIYGAARDRSLTPLAHRAVRWRVFGLPAGSGLRQPVHAADIAHAVARALDGRAAGHVIPMGGGERLPAAEMFARVRASLPVRTLPLHVPAPVIRLGARLVPPMRGALMRLQQDLLAENTELERLLDVHPRPFRPGPECWGPSRP
jgi:nucleoside-diphosphate-sugar epimerase